uniref:Cytochrome P450 n=2 Tax=Chenopodium quinoa TaxID=63459 RepID=A0A803LV90_CHEQI
MVVIQSAKMAKEVLQVQDKNFCNRQVLVGGKRLTYNGLDVVFAPYGEYYREIKKIFVVHLLSSKRVQSFAPIRHEEVSRIIQKISSLSSENKVVNLSELLFNCACSTICKIAFGKRYEDDEGTRSRFHDLLNEAQALFAGFFFTDYFPYTGWLDKLITGKYSKLEKTFKKFEEFYKEVIDEHLDLKRPKSDREDMVDILLQLKKERLFSFELTMDHIKAMLMDIILAGTDTSATMVIWVMTMLLKNPNAMKKVQSELRNKIQNKCFIEEGDLSNLEYFKAVVKETFRLHPAAPLLIPRKTLQNCTIEGFDIQSKTILYVNLWAISRDPKIWKDPDVFMPERFLECSINFLGQDFELIPFGAGRRICPGLHLGVASLDIMLANLLYFFDWELPSGLRRDDIDTEVQLGVTMHKKNPLCLLANKYY